MSEEKIIQHSANALHVLKDKQKGWGKKIMEFLEEILIIVFAVSITLLFHNWNDARHEHKLEREFLNGIKSDLDSGSVELQENIAGFQPNLDYYSEARRQITTKQYNAGYLDSTSWQLGNTLFFTFDMGRFEAFKSSGYLRLIENQTLLKQLMTLYTVNIPFQMEADRGMYTERKRYFDEHIGPRAIYIKGSFQNDGIQVSKLVDDPIFQHFIIDYSSHLQERKQQKLDLAKEMKKTADEIAAELDK